MCKKSIRRICLNITHHYWSFSTNKYTMLLKFKKEICVFIEFMFFEGSVFNSDSNFLQFQWTLWHRLQIIYRIYKATTSYINKLLKKFNISVPYLTSIISFLWLWLLIHLLFFSVLVIRYPFFSANICLAFVEIRYPCLLYRLI